MQKERKEKRSTKRPSCQQIDLLVNYMATHANFANGEYGGPMGAETNQRQWETIANLLNDNGPTRTVDQWRTTWRDKKRRAREEGAQINKKRKETGNLTEIPELTAQASTILGIIGHASSSGLDAEEETGIGQVYKNHNNINSMVISNFGIAEQAAEVVVPVVVQLAEPTEEYISELDEAMQTDQPTPPTAFIPGQARQNKLRAADFLQAEESSREVLKEIRDALRYQNRIAERQNRQRRLQRLDATRRKPFQF